MTIFLVKSTDVGAPSLTGQNGSFITVADYALVTVAGYTKTFSGTNKAIYKPPNGLGYSIRFVHDSAVSGAANSVTVRGLENATGIDTFINPYPSVAQIADTLSIWPTSNTANSTARPYFFIISDGSGNSSPFIYFGVDMNSSGGYQNYSWGEASPIEAVDKYCSFIIIRNTVSSNGPSVSYTKNATTSTAATPKLFWARSRDGSIISSQGYLYNAIATTYSSAIGGHNTVNSPAFPHPETGGMLLQKVLMVDNYSNLINTIGYGANAARAFMPNFWNALHGASNYSGISNYDVFEVNTSTSSYNSSAQFMFISAGVSSASYYGAIYEITNTWS